MIPFGKVEAVGEIGTMVREARRSRDIKQVDAAGLSGVGVRFLSELERGKASLEIGRVLRVLDRLGLEVWVVPRGGRVQWLYDE